VLLLILKKKSSVIASQCSKNPNSIHRARPISAAKLF
jgi:hypothetical protein